MCIRLQRQNLFLVLLLLGILLLGPKLLGGQALTTAGPSINFANGFPSAAPGLVLNEGAAVLDNVLQLTDGGQNERRSAFFAAPIGLASFRTTFNFVLRGKDKLMPDADGFTFVVQSNGPNALGSDGGGLGYGPPSREQPGPAITNSIAIKFDLHNNDGEGSSSTGLYIDGQAPTTPSFNLLLNDVNFHNGHDFLVTVSYDGQILYLTIIDQLTHDAVGGQFPVDIPGLLGGPTGYVGFTASTETAVENIIDWQLTSTVCCTDGEPSFPTGFTGRSDLALNGNADILDGVLRLTQDTPFETGSAFSSMAVPVNGFTSDFDFKLSAGYGDGFAFVLQSEGLDALGTGGGGLGYGPSIPGGGGEKIKHSVAVKFDLHSNAGEGSNSTGVYVDGASPTVPYTDLTPSGINLHRGHIFHARLTYAGGFLTLRITDLTEYAVFAATYPVNIRKAVGTATAYAGFTGATADLFDTIEILNWSMSSY